MVRTDVTTIGSYKVTAERKTHSSGLKDYAVVSKFNSENPHFIGDMAGSAAAAKDERDRAKLFAHICEAVAATYAEVPPAEAFDSSRDRDAPERWAEDAIAIPARVAALGKAKQAAYMVAVYAESVGSVSNRLNVGEPTVRQYLSDVLRGER